MSLYVYIDTNSKITDFKLVSLFNVLAIRLEKIPYYCVKDIDLPLNFITKEQFDSFSEYDITNQFPIFKETGHIPSIDFNQFFNIYNNIISITCTNDILLYHTNELQNNIACYDEKITNELLKNKPIPTLKTNENEIFLYIEQDSNIDRYRNIIKYLLMKGYKPILINHNDILYSEFSLYISTIDEKDIFKYSKSIYIKTYNNDFEQLANLYEWTIFTIEENLLYYRTIDFYDFVLQFEMPDNKSMSIVGMDSTNKTFLVIDKIYPQIKFIYNNTKFKFKTWFEHRIVCTNENAYNFVKNILKLEVYRYSDIDMTNQFVYDVNTFVVNVNEDGVPNYISNFIETITIEDIKKNIDKQFYVRYKSTFLENCDFKIDPYFFFKANNIKGELLNNYNINTGLLCYQEQLKSFYDDIEIYQGNNDLFVLKDNEKISLSEFNELYFKKINLTSLVEQVYINLKKEMKYENFINIVYIDPSKPKPTLNNNKMAIILSEFDIYDTITDLPEQHIFLKINTNGSREWIWFLIAEDYLYKNNIGAKYYIVIDNRIIYDNIFGYVNEITSYLDNNLQVNMVTFKGNLIPKDNYCKEFVKINNNIHDKHFYMNSNVGIYSSVYLRKFIEKYQNNINCAIRNSFNHDYNVDSIYNSLKRCLGYDIYNQNKYILEASPHQRKNKCIIFACYIRSKLYYDLLVYSLRYLTKLSIDIYLIYSTNMTNVLLPEHPRLKSIKVQNEGYDIKKYIYGLNSVYRKYDNYILTNDSIFFNRDPTYLFNLIDHVNYDLISLTDSNGAGNYHYQSFFLCFNTSVCSNILSDFSYLLNKGATITKKDAILKFEVGMSNRYIRLYDSLCLYKFGYFNKEKIYQSQNSTALNNFLRYYNESLIPFFKVRFAYNTILTENGQYRAQSIKDSTSEILRVNNNRALYDILLKGVGEYL